MNTHGPLEREVAVQMNVLARTIAEIMPPDFGFMFLTFRIGITDGGRMNYISNVHWEDALPALKELVANMEGRAFDPPRSKQ